ncbi:hypothetical protein [Aneurinibacillus sp. REN35]|uniref:hypothetical protein n=1 Tax=Aneurinibacillus sp. REN35 TaxID=3237286 RepID=UPI003528F30A
MKERLRDPFLWVGLGGLAYQALNQAGVVIPQETWDMLLDTVSYLCIGVGVVSGYKERKK